MWPTRRAGERVPLLFRAYTQEPSIIFGQPEDFNIEYSKLWQFDAQAVWTGLDAILENFPVV